MPPVSAGAAPEIRLIKERRVDGFDEVTWRKLACFHICLAAAETLLEFDCRSFIANSLSDHTGSSERHTPTVRLELSSTKSFPMLRTCESVK